MSEEINKKFKDMTRDLEMEAAAKSVLEAGQLVVLVATITGMIYQEARNVGLPRKVAREMAKDYWDNQIKGPQMSIFVSTEKEGDE